MSLLPRLHYACWIGNIELVKKALLEGDDVDEAITMTNGLGETMLFVTPLYMAAQEGHLAIVKHLIAMDAQTNIKCYNTRSQESFSIESNALYNGRLVGWTYLRAHRSNENSDIKEKNITGDCSMRVPLL